MFSEVMNPNTNVITTNDDGDKNSNVTLIEYSIFFTQCARHLILVYLTLIQNNFIIWVLLLSHLTDEKNDAKRE